MTSVASLFSQLESTQRAGSTSNANLAEDFNNFLNLLTVQLQHQDPLEPMDTNQFTQQIVQMTQVEQTVSMNERLGALIDAQETQRIQSAVEFVGKHADALGDTVPLQADGAEMFYALGAQASQVNVDVVTKKANGSDEVVRSFGSAASEAGVHRISWDGLDDDGAPVALDGTYRLRVTATTANGDKMETKIGFSGLVDELRNQDGALTLQIAGRSVNLDQIVAARAAVSNTTTAE